MACVRDKRGAFRVLVGTPEGGSQVGRPRRRWENNIKMDIEFIHQQMRFLLNF
jgi:hypothetical protein